ncbi:MAG: hypothetical protein FJ257_04275 [Phycisphaerae bacterium]|nr:hypothetical protein [Phycisphaerae bacterium]
MSFVSSPPRLILIPRRTTVAAIGAVAVAAFVSPAVLAGTTSPQLSVAVSTVGEATQTVTSTSGIPGSPGLYTYNGSVSSATSGEWSVSWALTGADTAILPDRPSISTNFTVANTSGSTRSFQILVTFASPVQLTPGVTSIEWGSLLQGTLTSNQGGVASLVGLVPSMLYGMINGSGVSFNNPSVPSTTTTTTIGPSGNTYTGAIPGGPNVSTIGYMMTFSLSANSTAVFDGSWSGIVVPAPGAAALLALAGVTGRRRRGR